jgi:hypothetical protein
MPKILSNFSSKLNYRWKKMSGNELNPKGLPDYKNSNLTIEQRVTDYPLFNKLY